MNIVEAYIKFRKGMVIIISGLSGSGKTKLAQNIKNDFKIEHVNIETYCLSSFNKPIKLQKDDKEVTVNDWDDIESYDWKKINEEINKKKEAGIVVSGPYFPKSKLKFDVDFHIHIKISKQQLIENRHKYIQEHPDKCSELLKILDTPFENMIINQITYPHYLKYIEESKIDKFINSKELSFDNIYDQITDYLFNKIQEYLNEYNKKIILSKNDKKKPVSKGYKNDVRDDGKIIDADDINDIYDMDINYDESTESSTSLSTTSSIESNGKKSTTKTKSLNSSSSNSSSSSNKPIYIGRTWDPIPGTIYGEPTEKSTFRIDM